MSGVWKRSMAGLVRHRHTKGPETDMPSLNHRATPRLYCCGKMPSLRKAGLPGSFNLRVARHDRSLRVRPPSRPGFDPPRFEEAQPRVHPFAGPCRNLEDLHVRAHGPDVPVDRGAIEL